MSVVGYESFNRDLESKRDLKRDRCCRDYKINILIAMSIILFLLIVGLLGTGIGLVYTYRPVVTDIVEQVLDTKNKIDESLLKIDDMVTKFNNMYVMAELACRNFLPSCPFKIVFNITAV